MKPEEHNKEPLSCSKSERELGSKPISVLFFKYLGINLVALVVTAVVVIIEGVIIGNGLGQHGLAITGLGMTLSILNLAMGAAFANGVATAAGNRLGAGDIEGARSAFARGFWLTEFVTISVAALIHLFAPQVAVAIGATPDLVPDMVLFIHLYVSFYPLTVGGQMLGAMLRVDEKPGYATAIVCTSSVSALVWLYVSVMVIKLGIISSGVYYGLSMGISFIAIFYFLFNKKTAFKIKLSDIKGIPSIAGEILTVGLPSFLVQLASLLYTVVVNNSLGALGAEGAEMQIAAFSLLNGYIVYIINLMWIGAQYAIQPIASFNYGARAYGRLKQLLRVSLAGTGAVVFAVSALFIVFAEPICTIFVGEGAEQLAVMGAHYTFPLCMLACLGTLSNVMCTYFQSVQEVANSIVMGVSRYLFFTIPLVLIMSRFMGVEGIWWAQPVADLMTFAFTLFFAARETRRLSRKQQLALL